MKYVAVIVLAILGLVEFTIRFGVVVFCALTVVGIVGLVIAEVDVPALLVPHSWALIDALMNADSHDRKLEAEVSDLRRQLLEARELMLLPSSDEAA